MVVERANRYEEKLLDTTTLPIPTIGRKLSP